MFEHSIKVPRQFKVAANILKKVSTEGGSVKTLLYDNKLRHFRTNVLYALVTSTIKHAADIDKMFIDCNILENEQRLDPWLAKVLTTELLFGKKILPGKSKPEQTILSYKQKFETYIAEHQDDFKTEVTIQRPRYVRINTNLLTTSDAIRAFQEEGYRFIRCTSGSYDDYLKQIQNLEEDDFTQDYHVKTLFVFPPRTKLHTHPLYLENKIILQDKATAMAVHLLAPPPGSVVMDLCAAPGMKTTQLSAFIRNEGKIYAVERNDKRYKTLCDFIEKTDSRCVIPLCKDALELKRGDYDDVEYILLDPSCSGSGMDLSVHNYIEQERLAKLTSLQEKFLKHAMNAFPNAKRIVYSTCSLFPEENERVITNVVKTSRSKWRVQDVKELLKGQWNNFGSGMYGSIGTRCMYAKTNSDMTIGFFLAVLDRDQKYFERKQINEGLANEVIKFDNIRLDETVDATSEIKTKRKKLRPQYIDDENEDIMNVEEKKRKTKKVKEKKELNESNNIQESQNDLQIPYEKIDTEFKKKKKKSRIEEVEENMENQNIENQKDIDTNSKKNRKNSFIDDNDQTDKTNDSEMYEFKIQHNYDKLKDEAQKSEEMDMLDGSIDVIKKKKKKRKRDDEELHLTLDQLHCADDGDIIVKKKKKKKSELQKT